MHRYSEVVPRLCNVQPLSALFFCLKNWRGCLCRAVLVCKGRAGRMQVSGKHSFQEQGLELIFPFSYTKYPAGLDLFLLGKERSPSEIRDMTDHEF